MPGAVYVGHLAGQNSYWVNYAGLFDDLSIFNRALSESEVQAAVRARARGGSSSWIVAPADGVQLSGLEAGVQLELDSRFHIR